MSEQFSGEDSWHWVDNGGRPEYGPSWTEELKDEVRAEQDYQCEGCGKTQEENGRSLPVHHIRKANSFDDHEARNDKSNLVALCNVCHPKWESMSPLRPV